MSRTCPNTKKLCTSYRCEGGCYWEPSADQPAPTPRTDSTIGADKFVPAWKVRKDMGQLERELSAARAEAERLREALLYAAETFRQINEGKHDPFSFDLRSNMRSAAGLALEKTRAALAATRKEEGNG